MPPAPSHGSCLHKQPSDRYLRVQPPIPTGAPACSGARAAASTPDEIGLQLIRVAKHLRSLRDAHGHGPASLDATAYPLMFSLCGDPIRITTLAERTHTEVSTTSRKVAALERDGVVTRIADPDDGRAQLVTLTGAGHEILATLRAQRQAWFEDLLADWDPAQIDTFLTLLTRLGDALETRGARAGADRHTDHSPETTR
jgi:DNA-binding MarR family transcriptional regulator